MKRNYLKAAWYRFDDFVRKHVRSSRKARPVLNEVQVPADTTIAFVIASPRSGTTWLQRALNEHPDVFCSENRLFGRHFDVITGPADRKLRVTLDEVASGVANRSCRHGLGIAQDRYETELAAAFAHSCFAMWKKYSGKSVLVDKVTPYPGTAQLVIERIRTTFPNAKIIQLIRDGRDVITSGVFHWLNRTLQDHESGRQSNDNRARSGRFFTDHELTEWAQTWREPVLALNADAVSHAPPLQIRYEQMIENQRHVLTSVFDFLEAGSDAHVVQKCCRRSTFERMSGGRRRGDMVAHAHVRKGVVGDWKNYFTREDGRLVERLAGKELRQLQYETESDWWMSLPEIVAEQPAVA